MKKYWLYLMACLLIPILPVQAQIQLPDIIGDNMVLQQNTLVKLWGTARANATVSVELSWDEHTYSVQTGKNGKWILSIPTPEADYAPQSITLSDGEPVTLNNILIGEVWFCSGQSNMEMPLNGFWNNPIMDANETIANASSYRGLHFVNIAKKEAHTPQETCEGKWQTSTPENLQGCSATAFHFAHSLGKALNVPVGIINCSWGGSTVEGWLPEEVLKEYADVDLDFSKERKDPTYMRPLIMYNGMLKPLQNYTVKGFLWYQGESNIGRHATYAERLATMVNLWRKEWALGELPFYFAEIAPFNYGGHNNGAYLREAQFKAQSLIPASGMISTNDLVEPYEADNIHPKNKTAVGRRLSYMALAQTYGIKGIADRGPVYRSMEVKEGKATLKFDHASDGFSLLHGITGFEVAGADRVFHPATAVVTGERTVMVSSEAVPEPVAIRYGFRDFLPGNLANTRGLPAYPFRTDNWE